MFIGIIIWKQNKIKYGHLVWLALFTSIVFVCDGKCRRQTWTFPLYNVFSEVGFLTKSSTLVVKPTKNTSQLTRVIVFLIHIRSLD